MCAPVRQRSLTTDSLPRYLTNSGRIDVNLRGPSCPAQLVPQVRSTLLFFSIMHTEDAQDLAVIGVLSPLWIRQGTPIV